MASLLAEYPVVVEFPLHWGEMDALGHVNNARYFTWLESARIELFARVGLGARSAGGPGPILASIQCDFRRPIVYPARIRVGTRVARVGTTSLTLEYEVAAGAPEQICAAGSSVVVLIDYRTQHKVAIEGALRANLEALGGSAETDTDV
ncbi:MAG: acyl-CoA thioesterase [Polyangiaceae bacterium]|nr:acyl-CoA thioesterase [Polyangiaceae bacterium]